MPIHMLTADEFDRLMSTPKAIPGAIIAMAYFTGMRRGEILGLTWDRVDLKKRLIYLEARHTKDKEPRKVPICAELFKMLQEMPGRLTESGNARHVFTYQGDPFKGNIRAGIKRGLQAGRSSLRPEQPGRASPCTTSATRSRPTCEGLGCRSRRSWRSPATTHGAPSTGTTPWTRPTCTGPSTDWRFFPNSVAFSVASRK